MGFQTTVRYDYAFGIPGEMKYDGPKRVNTGFLNSASAAYNIVGQTYFTQPAAGGAYVAGGTGLPGGLLCNPKVYASFGTSAGGPLAPTMTLANNVEAEFAIMGYYVANMPAACNIGDLVIYDTTTGAIASIPPVTAFTASQTTTVLTVTGTPTGNIGVGQTITSAAGVIIGEIISLGTGTGGAGTYNLNTSASVSSTTFTTPTIAPTGKAFVPNTVVDKFAQTAAGGLALLRMTN